MADGLAWRLPARASICRFGVTIGWVEGFKLNFFGAVLGFDIRRPTLKLPALGRLGLAAGL